MKKSFVKATKGTFLYLWAEFAMGRVCNGPRLLWAEFVMGRDVPEPHKYAAYLELCRLSAVVSVLDFSHETPDVVFPSMK